MNFNRNMTLSRDFHRRDKEEWIESWIHTVREMEELGMRAAETAKHDFYEVNKKIDEANALTCKLWDELTGGSSSFEEYATRYRTFYREQQSSSDSKPRPITLKADRRDPTLLGKTMNGTKKSERKTCLCGKIHLFENASTLSLSWPQNSGNPIRRYD